MKRKIIIRPEITGGAALALKRLAEEASTPTHTVTPTAYINQLLLEAWKKAYPGAMFPNKSGEIIPLDRTHPPLKS